MTFRVKDHRLPRKPQTPAQEAATQRAFRIFRLRGLWFQAALLSPDRCAAVQALIDQDLTDLGAESQTVRRAAEKAVWARVAENEAARAEMERELPF